MIGLCLVSRNSRIQKGPTVKKPDPKAIRKKAKAHREQAEREYATSEYPRYGRAVHQSTAAAIDRLADVVEENEDAGQDADNPYERRKAERVARLQIRAAKLDVESHDAACQAHAATGRIPLGQPILVGHHSEAGHRAALRRSDRAMRKAVDTDKKAKRVAARAQAAESRTDIDSDDPNACDKLQQRINELERQRELMKKINAEYRRAKGDLEKCPSLSDEQRRRLAADREGDWRGDRWRPFVDYQLSNLGANIRRLKDRLKKLSAMPADSDEYEIGPITVTIDPDAGRIYISTPGKNEDATKILRGRGWVWARSVGCWSRKLTPNAVVAARHVAERAAKVYAD